MRRTTNLLIGAGLALGALGTANTTLAATNPADATPGATAAPSTTGATPVHEEAVIESPRSSVPAGQTLPLRGKDFAASESYQLTLQGVLDDYVLRTVEVGAEGTFSLDVAIPADVRPGNYQIVAVASDGDVVARLEMTILAAVTGGAPSEMAEEAGAQMAGAMARHDDIAIERDRGGAAWGVIGLLVGLAGGAGIGLLRRGGRDG